MQLSDVMSALAAPFDAGAIEVKPGATTKDKTKALALAYADPRVYQERLDHVVGPDAWADDYQPMPSASTTVALLCRLTILGVTKADVGESPANDPNAWTSAAAQAFKRAASKFGLGRYLYGLPSIWVAYDDQRKQIIDQPATVQHIYRMAGIGKPQPRPQLVKPDPALQEAEAKFWAAFETRLGGRAWTRVIELVGPAPEPTSISDWRELYRRVNTALKQEAAA